MEMLNCVPTDFPKMWLTFNGPSPLEEITHNPKYRIKEPQCTGSRFPTHYLTYCKYQLNCKEVFYFFNAQVFIFNELFLLDS